MNIQALETYVESKNRWQAIFKGRKYSLLRAVDRRAIADMIDADMSPENLTCDGELPTGQVRDRVRYLSRCAEELLSIDPSVTFSEMGV